MIAKIFHCGCEWSVEGILHNGFFVPDNKDDMLCKECGEESKTYMAIDIPLNENKGYNED